MATQLIKIEILGQLYSSIEVCQHMHYQESAAGHDSWQEWIYSTLAVGHWHMKELVCSLYYIIYILFTFRYSIHNIISVHNIIIIINDYGLYIILYYYFLPT